MPKLTKPSVCVGMTFRKLKVLEMVRIDHKHRKFWLCACDCGNKKIIRQDGLVGKTRPTISCGCQTSKSATTHGMEGTSIYHIWKSMRSRCDRTKHIHYKNYGGRGISYTKRWEKFENFYADMGARPPGMTLDRINNTAGYSKENCRWATHKQQSRNTRKNKIIVFRGETKCLVEWAEIVGLRPDTIGQRLQKGWSVEAALLTPVQFRKPRQGVEEC